MWETLSFILNFSDYGISDPGLIGKLKVDLRKEKKIRFKKKINKKITKKSGKNVAFSKKRFIV